MEPGKQRNSKLIYGATRAFPIFLCHDDGGKKTQLQQQITIRYYGHKMGYTLLCLNYKSFMANLTFLRVVVNYTAQKADFLFLKYRERAHANKMTAAASAVEPFYFRAADFYTSPHQRP
jgi:hypothetical protein